MENESTLDTATDTPDSQNKGIVSFVTDAIIWNLSGNIFYKFYLAILLAFMAGGVYAYSFQAANGCPSRSCSYSWLGFSNCTEWISPDSTLKLPTIFSPAKVISSK